MGQMLTQEPIRKPSSISSLSPTHSRPLLIYGDNTCPPGFGNDNSKTTLPLHLPVDISLNAQQPPWKTQHLCNWLLVECEIADPSSIFLLFNPIPNRLSSRQNTSSSQSQVAQKKPQPPSTNSHGDLLLFRFQHHRLLFFSPSFFPFFFRPFCLLPRLHSRESGADAGVQPRGGVRGARSSALGCRGV